MQLLLSRGIIGWQTEPVQERFAIYGGTVVADCRMLGDVFELEIRGIGGSDQAFIKLAAQRDMHGTVNEIIGFGDADEIAGVAEVRVLKGAGGRRRPLLHFLEQQFRGPTAPRERATADGKQQAGIAQSRMAFPRPAEVRRSAGNERQILDVFRQDERTGFQNENAPAMGWVIDKEVFGDGGAEGSAADDNDIEVAFFAANGLLRAGDGLIERVAYEAPEVIEGEGRRFRGQHNYSFPSWFIDHLRG